MNNQADLIIKELGGTTSVANLCGVTKGAVSQWRKNGIPKGHLNFLVLKFPRKIGNLAAK